MSSFTDDSYEKFSLNVFKIVNCNPSQYFTIEATLVGGDRGGGGSETPASRSFYSRFPPPPVGVPASLFYFYFKMLRNIANFFSFSSGSRHFGDPASRLFSSRLPYPSRALFSEAPGPLSPFTPLIFSQCTAPLWRCSTVIGRQSC